MICKYNYAMISENKSTLCLFLFLLRSEKYFPTRGGFQNEGFVRIILEN